MNAPDRLATLVAEHDRMVVEMFKLGGPLEADTDILFTDDIPDQYEGYVLNEVTRQWEPDKNAREAPERDWSPILRHRIECMRHYLPKLEAEARAKAEQQRIKAEEQRKQNEQHARRKAEEDAKKTAEKAAIKARWDRVGELVWAALDSFTGFTPAGFIEWFNEYCPEDQDTAWDFGAGVRHYLASLLLLMKTDSVQRKAKQADAIVERMTALHGHHLIDPRRELPSTVAQFDDERYVPPHCQWHGGYGEKRRLQWIKYSDVGDAWDEFEWDTLPTLTDPPLDTIQRLIDAAPVRAADEVADATEIDWDVRGLIQHGTVVLVTAKPKVGKSFFTGDLTLALAGDAKEWRGLRTVPGRHALYLNAEGSMSQRLAAHKKAHGDKLPKKFFTMPLKVKLDSIGMAALTQQIASHEDDHGRVDILIIDPLARAIAGSEVSDRDMAAFIDNAEALTAGGTRTVIVVHHLGKDESAGPRGHSSLSGAVTAEIRITLDPKTGIRHVSVPFCREAEEWAGARFRLRPVELGQDKFGEPLQSAVVEWVGGTAKESMPKLGKNQRAVLACLQALSAEIGEPDDAGHVRVPLNVLMDRAGVEMEIADVKRIPERVRGVLKSMEAHVGFDGEAAWVRT